MIRDSRRPQPFKPEILVTASLVLAVSVVPAHAAQPNNQTCTEMHQQALDLLKSSSHKALKADQAANKTTTKPNQNKAIKPETKPTSTRTQATTASTADNIQIVNSPEKTAITPSVMDFQTSFRNLVLGLKQKNCVAELESLNEYVDSEREKYHPAAPSAKPIED